MNISRTTTKVFAFFFLIFAGFISGRSQDSINVLEAGTKITVSMDNEINSEVAGVDDTFTTTVAEPVKIRETIVLPAGTVIEGRVTKVEHAAGGGKNGAISVRFETIRFENGEKRAIEGVMVNEPKAASSKTSLWAIIGGTAAGALIGAVTGAENGALIGAGVGAGAGAGASLLKKGRDVRIRTDEKFEIKLVKQVTLPVRDY
ncbi:MAG: hypothetical protein JSS81_03590 [Acidobacteria bacterium]|nr:hypothetical protein [Acidobacteriota bacterium]